MLHIGAQLYHQLTPFEIVAKSAVDEISNAIPRFGLFVMVGIAPWSVGCDDFSLQLLNAIRMIKLRKNIL